jgi:chaperonin GroES
MEFRPLHVRIAIKRAAAETKTAGGRPASKRATRFYSANGSGSEVKIDGQELLFMKESDIMGVLDK